MRFCLLYVYLSVIGEAAISVTPHGALISHTENAVINIGVNPLLYGAEE